MAALSGHRGFSALRHSFFTLFGILALTAHAVSAQSIPQCRGDVNGDGVVDINDTVAVLSAFGSTGAAYKANYSADLFQDKKIDGADLAIVLSLLGTKCVECGNDLNRDGRVDAADLSILLGSGSASGSEIARLLNDWNLSCSEIQAALLPPSRQNPRSRPSLVSTGSRKALRSQAKPVAQVFQDNAAALSGR